MASASCAAGPNACSSCYKLGALIRLVHRGLHRSVKDRAVTISPRPGYKHVFGAKLSCRSANREQTTSPASPTRRRTGDPSTWQPPTPLPPAAPKPANRPQSRRARKRAARSHRLAQRGSTAGQEHAGQGSAHALVHQAESAVRQTETATRDTVGVFGDYAERAVLIPVGAALIARDRVVSSVNDTISTYSPPPRPRRSCATSSAAAAPPATASSARSAKPACASSANCASAAGTARS